MSQKDVEPTEEGRPKATLVRRANKAGEKSGLALTPRPGEAFHTTDLSAYQGYLDKLEETRRLTNQRIHSQEVVQELTEEFDEIVKRSGRGKSE